MSFSYAWIEKSSFVFARARLYLVRRMKGQETVNKYSNPGELYALELAAHRARSKEMRRLAVEGVRAVKALFARAVAALSARKVTHA